MITGLSSSSTGASESSSSANATSAATATASRTTQNVGIPCSDPTRLATYAQSHIDHVRSSSEKDAWTMEMWSILKVLIDDEKYNRQIFNDPVDDKIVLGYYTVITNPMDLGTIRFRLEDGYYSTMEEFRREVILVFANARLYNKPDHFVHKGAVELKKMFEDKYNEAERKLATQKQEADSHKCEYCDEGKRNCAICLQKCLVYAPPEYRCSPPCKQRIPRNAVYYRIGGERGQHWCQRCYSNLRDEFVGILGQKLHKSELEKLVNSEVFTEAWVRCSRCTEYSHHICTMFLEPHYTAGPRQTAVANPRRNVVGVDRAAHGASSFVCLNCIAGYSSPPSSLASANGSRSPRAASMRAKKAKVTPSLGFEKFSFLLPELAETLPHCDMSHFLQQRVQERAEAELMQPPANPGQALLNPQLKREDAQRIAKTLKVRVVSHSLSDGQMESRARKWVETQSEIARRAALTKLSYHAKTICLFQEDEQDAFLTFALYVQEYGQECPANSVNHGNVYVSYLDSAPYIRPHRLRSLLYKELMFSYFLWVRARGFKSAYIWACPPQKGDAYVMHCHPKWQRNPSNERLRKWYNSIFKRATAEGIVETDTTLYDMHLQSYKPIVHTRRGVAASSSVSHGAASDREVASTSASTTTASSAPHVASFHLEKLPYFSGDFCQTELEIILSTLESADIEDMMEQKFRKWWRDVVWGPHALVELVPAEKDEMEVDEDDEEVEPPAGIDQRVFTKKGLPRFTYLISIKPSLPDPSRETLLEHERDCCTFQERDEWIMRKVAQSVRPLKDSFLVIKFTPETSATGASKATTEHDSRLKRGKADPTAAAAASLPGSSPSAYTLPQINLWQGRLADPDQTLPRTCFDWRIGLLDLLVSEHMQFDTWRHAKFTTAVLLGYLHKTLTVYDPEASHW